MPIDPITGLYKAVPGSALMNPEDATQFDLGQTGADAPIDPRMYNSIFASRLADEAARRGLDTNRLGSLLQDPLADQRQQVNAMNAAQQAAIQRGFTGGKPVKQAPGVYTSPDVGSPMQQAAEYDRSVEMYKAQEPTRLEMLRQSGAQELARQGAAAAEANIPKYADIAKTLGPGTELDLGGGRKIRIAATQTPTPVAKDFDSAAREYDRLKNLPFLGRIFEPNHETKLAQAEQDMWTLDPTRAAKIPGLRRPSTPTAAPALPGATPGVSGRTVRMLAPDGRSLTVPESEVSRLTQLGAKVAQ